MFLEYRGSLYVPGRGAAWFRIDPDTFRAELLDTGQAGRLNWYEPGLNWYAVSNNYGLVGGTRGIREGSGLPTSPARFFRVIVEELGGDGKPLAQQQNGPEAVPPIHLEWARFVLSDDEPATTAAPAAPQSLIPGADNRNAFNGNEYRRRRLEYGKRILSRRLFEVGQEEPRLGRRSPGPLGRRRAA